MNEFGKKYWRDASLLVIGFCLTTIIGGVFQDRSWEKQHKESLLQAERESAEKVFTEVSSSMDDRLYRTRDLLEAYKLGDKKEIERRWVVYNDGCLTWGRNTNNYFALLSRYYGNDKSDNYRKKIYNLFLHLDFQLRHLDVNDKNVKAEVAEIDEALIKLSNVIFVFDVELLNLLKNAKVGQFQRLDS
jgi:hypothetical protein